MAKKATPTTARAVWLSSVSIVAKKLLGQLEWQHYDMMQFEYWPELFSER